MYCGNTLTVTFLLLNHRLAVNTMITMTIRFATHTDLPAMLTLLNSSLGTLGGMRSAAYWQWKHLQNPFGVSPVLLAFEGDRMIGLRAFLLWQFSYQGKIIRAYRAVDTATHPEYQGKGIFKKLTLEMLNLLTTREPAFIFNTPNHKSMPGYLKMGWQVAGKTPLLVKIHPLNMLQHVVKSAGSLPPAAVPDVLPPAVVACVNAWKLHQREYLTTDYTESYLRWRYGHVPALRYGLQWAEQDEGSCAIFYRIKATGRMRELRITDLFYTGKNAKAAVRHAVRQLVKTHQPDVTTVLNDAQGNVKKVLPGGFFSATSRGLTITMRQLNDPQLAALAHNQQRWNVSAGTLELF